jgi:hypothetical protein
VLIHIILMLNPLKTGQVIVKVMLRPTVSRQVCLGVQTPSVSQDQIFVTVICGFVDVGRPLWREDGSVLSRVLVPRDSWPYFTVSDSRLPPNLEGQVPVFIYPRNRVAQLYPQALGSLFNASCDSQGYGGSIRTRLHTGIKDWISSK